LFPNHFAIRKYNNSLAYALAVGLLADRFAGMGPLVKPWPAEVPLSLADRMTAQRALNALGYEVGAPDGLVGLKTRGALRGWQKSRGLVADGYLTPVLVSQLRSEAEAKAIPAAAAAPTASATPSAPAAPAPPSETPTAPAAAAPQ
jgi:peptidoglycan hydrolase-like protein with peptidoglycan-binding domain